MLFCQKQKKKKKPLVFTQNIKKYQDIFSVFGGNIQCCADIKKI
jgi:hypothetical protein